MSVSGMAEVIAAHSGYMCWTVGPKEFVACASPVCDWESEADDPASAHYVHVAEELAKAGYGLLPDGAAS